MGSEMCIRDRVGVPQLGGDVEAEVLAVLNHVLTDLDHVHSSCCIKQQVINISLSVFSEIHLINNSEQYNSSFLVSMHLSYFFKSFKTSEYNQHSSTMMHY